MKQTILDDKGNFVGGFRKNRDLLFVSKEGADSVLKGKSIEALLDSQEGMQNLKKFFGGGVEDIPSSIMRVKRPKVDKKIDAPTFERSYDQTSPGKEKAKKHKGMIADAYYISGRGCGAGALSTFPQNIGRSVLLLYSDPGQTVFDPFAGHNSRMDLCVKAGRHYVGCDLSTSFMEFNRKRAEELRQDYPDIKIKLHHGDSRKVRDVKSGTGDFTITSPPYWDIEYYGDEPEQLGKTKTYQEFLDGLGEVLKENFRILKSGAYAVWFVNDFRKKGKFHLYHVDTIRLAEKAGFIAHDLLVSDLGRSIRDCFVNQTMKTKILPKRHEYGLVFRKE